MYEEDNREVRFTYGFDDSGDGKAGKVVVVVVGVAVKDRPCFEGTSVGGKVRQPAGESSQDPE